MGPSIDWNGIRPLNGARSSGFEDLCAQLARAESPTNSRFERKGAPDGGVECYCVLDDGTEWGWQAKYIDDLGDSQWGQIDDSVRTALEKHPRLVRYFVCVPYDRPDARVPGRKSAKDRWDDYVARWTAEADTRGMSVAFEYWGSHELILRLSRPELVGKIRFWFDTRAFDSPWFTNRLDEALKSAGPRYTPEVHVDLPIAAEFESFGRTQIFSREVKSQAPELRDKMHSLENAKLSLVDPELEACQHKLFDEVQEVLTNFGLLDIPPNGDPGLSEIVDRIAQAESTIAALEDHQSRCEGEYQQRPRPQGPEPSVSEREADPFREYHSRLMNLVSQLEEAKEAVVRGQRLASANFMILSGDAGTGKTHLLCDIAKQRLSKGLPTVLLMGQRFTGSNTPWSQALQQMDLAELAVDEFIGALEAAAQAANCRALFLIDAINEGAGRLIWPPNIAAFVAQLERSSWIGVVVSVRTSYEEMIVPEDLRTQAIHVRHHGFSDYEYDAAKTFFQYYGLELSSTPLLNPEFRNPLFLKTLCTGLRARGDTRLPRGFHGITSTMELYLDAINKKLSTAIQYNPSLKLVKNSLEALSLELLNSGKRWLPLLKAEELVNASLQGREFDRSLYHGLVSEGLLVEDIPRHGENAGQVSVFIAFDRFADYLAAKTLLDKHFDPFNPTVAFSDDNPLAFLSDEKQYVAPGMLEALFVQVPERTGMDLVDLAPGIKKRRGAQNAYIRSIVWRTAAACTATTKTVVEKFLQNPDIVVDILDALLTVATIPGHPLNALFLDQKLRKDSMPIRDGWWTIAIHKSWGGQEALDRLVDWSTALSPDASVDEDVLDLCATSLAWTFTSSNRILRDRATQALAILLFDRTDAVVKLVERFWDVDDPYVLERVYAAAYSVVCKNHDPSKVRKIAEVIYSKVFSSGTPPVHVLIRDYATGIIQRALFLKSQVSIDTNLVRPPFKSKWPEILSEEGIKPYLPNWEGDEAGKSEWARNRIGSSVMSGDFARYVLGTNSSSNSRRWLDLKLIDPAWIVQPRYEDLAKEFVAGLAENQEKAWKTFNAADKALDDARLQVYMASWFSKRGVEGNSIPDGASLDPTLENSGASGKDDKVEGLEKDWIKANATLEDLLPPQLQRQLKDLLKVKSLSREEREPPGFDLGRMQRFILKRVFDLGWTTELFGRFDRYEIGYRGRGEKKAERIGKKYQWIAYYEILALLCDHYQFKEAFRDYEGAMSFVGPWQGDLRDIDPTCGSKKVQEEESLESDTACWWASLPFENWITPERPDEWVKRTDDLPDPKDLLLVSNPDNGTKWFNGLSHFNWSQEIPPDMKSTDMGRRELWCLCTGYLIPQANAVAFLEWAKGVDFWGRWMPEEPEIHQIFLGEYGWSAASAYFQQQCLREAGWESPEKGCPTKIEPVAVEYNRSGGGLDCSVDKGYHIKLPTWSLFKGLGLKWSGNAGDFLNEQNFLTARDPSMHEKGPGALLLREDLLREYLERENLTLCWTVLGEKRYLGPGYDAKDYFSTHISGAYILDGSNLNGTLKFTPEDRVPSD
jgi:hypothetical protein